MERTNKKSIIIASICVAVAVVLLVGTFIYAGVNGMSVGQLCRKAFGIEETLDDDVLAVVNGDTIYVAEYRKNIELWAECTANVEDFAKYYGTYDVDVMLERAINMLLSAAEAKRRGFEVTDEEVDAMIKSSVDTYTMMSDSDDADNQAQSRILLEMAKISGLNSIEEYYGGDEARENFANMILGTKLISAEVERINAEKSTDTIVYKANVSVVRGELLEKLKKKAYIVINQEKLGMLKREAAERAGA